MALLLVSESEAVVFVVELPVSAFSEESSFFALDFVEDDSDVFELELVVFFFKAQPLRTRVRPSNTTSANVIRRALIAKPPRMRGDRSPLLPVARPERRQPC